MRIAVIGAGGLGRATLARALRKEVPMFASLRGVLTSAAMREHGLAIEGSRGDPCSPSASLRRSR